MFLLQFLSESRNKNSQLSVTLNIALEDKISRQNLIQELKARGAQDQLIMFLSSPGE